MRPTPHRMHGPSTAGRQITANNFVKQHIDLVFEPSTTAAKTLNACMQHKPADPTYTRAPSPATAGKGAHHSQYGGDRTDTAIKQARKRGSTNTSSEVLAPLANATSRLPHHSLADKGHGKGGENNDIPQ